MTLDHTEAERFENYCLQIALDQTEAEHFRDCWVQTALNHTGLEHRGRDSGRQEPESDPEPDPIETGAKPHLHGWWSGVQTGCLVGHAALALRTSHGLPALHSGPLWKDLGVDREQMASDPESDFVELCSTVASSKRKAALV